MASHERDRPCPRTPYYAPEFTAQSVSLSEASRMLLRRASSNPWVSFQHLQLGQPPRTGTPWTSVTMTRPTATVAQVMTSSSQVQSPPSSHPRALSVCVLVLCVCACLSWLASGYGQTTGEWTLATPRVASFPCATHINKALPVAAALFRAEREVLLQSLHPPCCYRRTTHAQPFTFLSQ